MATLGEEQIEEITWGLKNSNFYFLWVVRESEVKKLLKNFLQETTKKGLVVSWCPQQEVLAHKQGWSQNLELRGATLLLTMVALAFGSAILLCR